MTELDKSIKQIKDKYGEKSISYGKESEEKLKIRRISTGSISLDIETGGGWVKDKVNELFGNYSSGKTFLAYQTVAKFQEENPGEKVGWIDFEHAFDYEWAEKIGVNVEDIVYVNPNYMEHGLDIADKIIKTGELPLLIIDSLAAACPKEEFEKEMEDFTVGLRARLGNKFIRKVGSYSSELSENSKKTTTLIINQIYSGIGPFSKEETPGGRQLQFLAMLRVRIRKSDESKNKYKETVAQELSFLVEKNKTFPPRRNGSFWFNLVDNKRGEAGSIWRMGEILNYGVINGIIEQSGPWYTLPIELGGEKFKGKEELANYVYEEEDEFLKKLEDLIMDTAKEAIEEDEQQKE